MQVIKAVLTDNGIIPESELPKNAKAIICNGETYVCYFDGEEVPSLEQQAEPGFWNKFLSFFKFN